MLLDFDSAASILDDGYQPTENGYGHLRDGGIQVSARTDMPASPRRCGRGGSAGTAATRAATSCGIRGRTSRRAGTTTAPDGRYVGRTSLIEEYIGSRFTRGAIAFVEPSVLGLDPARLGDGIAVCARLGSSDVPVDIGWFVHHVRPTATGSEMRSRFWMGGRHVAVRGGNRLADRAVRPVAARQLPDPRDLMVHCAQEMNHLAAFLPDLHRALAA